MEVLLKISLSGPGGVYPSGSLYKCSIAEGENLIAKGYADKVETKKRQKKK